MISESDVPGNMVEVATISDQPSPSPGGDTHEEKKSKCCDMSFVKSQYGIIISAEYILSFMAVVSVFVPTNRGAASTSIDSYFKYVSCTCLITCSIWYILYGLAVTKKLKFIPWDITEMLWCAFYALMYLISSSVLAANTCSQDAYKAAAVFGFLCSFAITRHAYLVGCLFSGRSGEAAAGQSNTEETGEESRY